MSKGTETLCSGSSAELPCLKSQADIKQSQELSKEISEKRTVILKTEEGTLYWDAHTL